MEQKVYDAAHRNAAVKRVLVDNKYGTLTPSQIARVIGEPWCMDGRWPSSAAVSPVLKRIGAIKHSRGNWMRDLNWEAV